MKTLHQIVLYIKCLHNESKFNFIHNTINIRQKPEAMYNIYLYVLNVIDVSTDIFAFIHSQFTQLDYYLFKWP